MTLPTNVHWCSVYMELQICERDVYIKDCILLVLDQKPLGLLFNLFKTQYTFEKGHWLANKLERINIYEAFVCARTRVQTENIIYLHNLHKLLWRHITRFVLALRRRSLPPVFPRGVGTATRRLRPRWRPVELNDRHLRSHGKIGDCEQSISLKNFKTQLLRCQH